MKPKKEKKMKAWAVIDRNNEIECDFRGDELITLISPFKNHALRIKKEDKKYYKVVPVKIRIISPKKAKVVKK